ncbi:MAG: hypothetical protein ACYCTB_10585 [bacterium]
MKKLKEKNKLKINQIKSKKIVKKDKNVSVRLSIDLFNEYQEAKEIALNNNINLSLSAIIRNSVEEYIEKVRKIKSIE